MSQALQRRDLRSDPIRSVLKRLDEVLAKPQCRQRGCLETAVGVPFCAVAGCDAGLDASSGVSNVRPTQATTTPTRRTRAMRRMYERAADGGVYADFISQICRLP